MKKTITIRKLPVIFALVLASCGKKGETPKAQSNLLTASPWRGAKDEWRTTGGAWVAPPSWAGVEYGPQETVTFLDGGAYSTSPAGGAGTWQLSAGGKTLTLFTSGGNSRTYTVSSLTGSTLQLSDTLDSRTTYTVEGSGPNPTYTYYDKKRTTLTH